MPNIKYKKRFSKLAIYLLIGEIKFDMDGNGIQIGIHFKSSNLSECLMFVGNFRHWKKMYYIGGVFATAEIERENKSGEILFLICFFLMQ